MLGINIESVIQSGGLLLIGFIIFAETGLLLGFFLPGDTLLFTAGFFASQHVLPLGWLILVVVGAAIVGDNVGYTIGQHAGPRIFKKEDSLIFRQSYIRQAEKFYEQHGGKTMLFARFLPIIRTFAPVVAGVGRMPRKRFVIFDGIGAIIWGTSITLLGYWLGSKISNIDKYLLPIILGVVILSFGPTIYHIIKDPKIRQKITHKFKKAK